MCFAGGDHYTAQASTDDSLALLRTPQGFWRETTFGGPTFPADEVLKGKQQPHNNNNSIRSQLLSLTDLEAVPLGHLALFGGGKVGFSAAEDFFTFDSTKAVPLDEMRKPFTS